MFTVSVQLQISFRQSVSMGGILSLYIRAYLTTGIILPKGISIAELLSCELFAIDITVKQSIFVEV